VNTVVTEGHGASGADPLFDRPVFIVSPPRSGSTLLFETLAGAPGLFTTGGENHAAIETIPGLQLRHRDFDSNRLQAADATPEVVRELRARFLDKSRDRDGRAPAGRFRLLEKTPKNALRIPFLMAAFPEARFVYLYRDPRQVIASMIDAWLSGHFRTYLQLPGWPHPHWSLLLTPGWRALADKPLPEIVAGQWQAAMQVMLDDLEALPATRRCSVRYDRFVADPPAAMERLRAQLDYSWDRPLSAQLPASRYTLTAPDANKWRRHAPVIEPLLPALRGTIERAEALAG
jgi:hypothetical protein